MTLALAIQNPFELFSATGAQHALIAVLGLSLIAAVLGWAIVLRDLPFFTHATGAGAYPVLVLGAIGGVAAAVSALIGAVLFALLVAAVGGGIASRPRENRNGRRDALIGIVVVAALAIGSLLAQHASGPVPAPEAMLFGAAGGIDLTGLITIGVVALLVLAAGLLFSRHWLARGFDPEAAAAGNADAILLLCVALAVGAALPLTGALLAGALLILPAASVRMFAARAGRIPILTFALATIESVLGLYLALNFDLPAGAAIAAVAGGGFFACALVRTLRAPALRPLRIATAAVSLVLASALLAGCGGSTATPVSADEPLKVVATTPQIADILKNVGGEAIDVRTLLGPNLDPHEYEYTQADVQTVKRANVVFRSGGAIDSWILPAMKAADAPLPPVDLSRAAVLLANPDGTINPHWYLTPPNIARAAQKARDELIKADPSSRETFRTNTTAYLDEIDRTSAALTRCSSLVPRGEDALVAEHNDFEYLADAFGFRIVAKLSADGTGEPTRRQIARTITQARARGARAMIVSSGEASSVERAISRQLGIPLLALYSDNLTTGDDVSTLLGALDYDVARIVAALSGGAAKCAGLK